MRARASARGFVAAPGPFAAPPWRPGAARRRPLSGGGGRAAGGRARAAPGRGGGGRRRRLRARAERERKIGAPEGARGAVSGAAMNLRV